MTQTAGVLANREISLTSNTDVVEAFIRAEFPALAGYCGRILGDPALGADVAQEVMVRTWGRWTRVRSPRAYAYKVATRLALRILQQQRSHSMTDSRVLDAARTASDAEALEMRDLVARLPARLREVVTLHYLADLPISEVARVIGRPTGTVKQRLHEARGLLAAMWKDAER